MFGSGTQSINRWGSLLSKRTGCVLVTITDSAFGFHEIDGGDSNCGFEIKSQR